MPSPPVNPSTIDRAQIEAQQGYDYCVNFTERMMERGGDRIEGGIWVANLGLGGMLAAAIHMVGNPLDTETIQPISPAITFSNSALLTAMGSAVTASGLIEAVPGAVLRQACGNDPSRQQ